jgi:hypothetical protein
MRLQLRRREFTTASSDPTVVVEYEDRAVHVKITEFQNVYRTEPTDPRAPGCGELVQALGETLHRTLEELHCSHFDESHRNDYVEHLEQQLREIRHRAVCELLADRGLVASYEYPGYVHVSKDTGAYWAFGINQEGQDASVWTGQLHDSMGDVVGLFERQFPDANDVKAIADALAEEVRKS